MIQQKTTASELIGVYHSVVSVTAFLVILSIKGLSMWYILRVFLYCWHFGSLQCLRSLLASRGVCATSVDSAISIDLQQPRPWQQGIAQA